jgi:hypothetical protein
MITMKQLMEIIWSLPRVKNPLGKAHWDEVSMESFHWRWG